MGRPYPSTFQIIRHKPVSAPEQLAAIAVKGAALIEKGVTNSAEWTRELVKQFGPEIRPYLAGIRKQSEQLRARALAKQNTSNTPPRFGWWWRCKSPPCKWVRLRVDRLVLMFTALPRESGKNGPSRDRCSSRTWKGYHHSGSIDRR